jgi:hypothetical protein
MPPRLRARRSRWRRWTPAARDRAFAAVLVMQSTELARVTIEAYNRGGFKLDAVGVEESGRGERITVTE